MTFLLTLSWVYFVLCTLLMLLVFWREMTGNKEAQKLKDDMHFIVTGQHIHRSWFNYKVYTLLALWVATGTFNFW